MSLPTGLILEGEKLTGKEKKVLWIFLGLALTHTSICFGGASESQRICWFYSESVVYELGGSRKKNKNKRRKKKGKRGRR